MDKTALLIIDAPHRPGSFTGRPLESERSRLGSGFEVTRSDEVIGA